MRVNDNYDNWSPTGQGLYRDDLSRYVPRRSVQGSYLAIKVLNHQGALSAETRLGPVPRPVAPTKEAHLLVECPLYQDFFSTTCKNYLSWCFSSFVAAASLCSSVSVRLLQLPSPTWAV